MGTEYQICGSAKTGVLKKIKNLPWITSMTWIISAPVGVYGCRCCNNSRLTRSSHDWNRIISAYLSIARVWILAVGHCTRSTCKRAFNRLLLSLEIIFSKTKNAEMLRITQLMAIENSWFIHPQCDLREDLHQNKIICKKTSWQNWNQNLPP